MKTLFATYGTLREAGALPDTPELKLAHRLGRCEIRGSLFMAGGYPALKLGDGTVVADLLELPAHFDFTRFDGYEDYHPRYPWACRYVRRRIILRHPAVQAWVYHYVWPLDGASRIVSGDWLDAVEANVRVRRFRGDRLPMRMYEPDGWSKPIRASFLDPKRRPGRG